MVSTSSHSEQRSQAHQSRWYCGNTWESRSVPNLKRKPVGNYRLFLFIRNFFFENVQCDRLSLSLISLYWTGINHWLGMYDEFTDISIASQVNAGIALPARAESLLTNISYTTRSCICLKGGVKLVVLMLCTLLFIQLLSFLFYWYIIPGV